ncbi:MAG: hypothetical protein IRZ03_08490 [Acidobacterium ailaaui]|nr:hypothetical protein [Pseudacidobacterium ailaaui]
MAAWAKSTADSGYLNLDAVGMFRVVQQGNWNIVAEFSAGGAYTIETGLASEADALSRIEEIILGNG